MIRVFLKRLTHYIPSLVVALVIAYGSLVREPHISLPHFEGADKCAHTLMYLLLAAVMLWDCRRDGWHKRVVALIVFIVSIGYGGLIEILQEQFFYPRTGDWLDWLADCIGSAVGIGLSYFVWKHRRKDSI